MGTLVVMAYGTKLFANLADHTYVKTAAGDKAWGCWGGKKGGEEIRRGEASTARADAIAEPNERAGLKCYLINGVCHQAANRILLAAGLTVRDARGYHVSESLFGAYGRPRGPLGTCRSPFEQHAEVLGDLEGTEDPPPSVPAAAPRGARAAGPRAAATRGTRAPRAVEAARAERAERAATAERAGEARYLRGVLDLYAKADVEVAAAPRSAAAAGGAAAAQRRLSGAELEGFELALFMHKARFQLGAQLDRPMSARLQHIRRSAGRSLVTIEDWFSHGDMKPVEFADAFDAETRLFQEMAANSMKAAQYKALFGLPPGQFVTLADRRIVRRVYASP